MTDESSRDAPEGKWRRQAESIARENEARSPSRPEELSPREMRSALHELRVHQIELELQNEELRRAQVELAAAHERYFDLYDLAPVGYCTLSENGIILEANLTAATLLGVARSALVERPLTQFILPEDQDTYYLYSKQLAESAASNQCELRIRGAEPGRGWVLLVTTAAKDNDGVTTFRTVISDISDRKLADANKQKLELLLRETHKLQAVGNLAGGVAHGFNNLLQIIIGYADVLQNRPDLDAEDAEALDEIRKAAQRAALLTSQLLTFSQRQISKPVHVNLNDLIEDSLKVLRHVIGASIDIRFVAGKQLGCICADKGQIQQILSNLFANAKDAMPDGGILTVKTENTVLDASSCRENPWATEGSYVLLTVTDNGHGMNEATRSQIFEPFFTTKAAGLGVGLGLATVYGVVKQHHGFIHAASDPGRETTFRIYLPRVPAPPEAAVDESTERVTNGTETLLIAEDEAEIRNLSRRMLSAAGYTVLAATDGEDALRLFEEHADSIDMVILDVMMPKLGGKEVMNRIQAKYPGMRFLFSSGYSEGAIHTEFGIHDGLRLIAKPYQKAEFLRAVRESLDAPRHP